MKDGHVLKLDKIGLMFSGFELKQILLKKITNLSTINYNDCFLLIFFLFKSHTSTRAFGVRVKVLSDGSNLL